MKDQVREAVEKLVERGIESLAIGFLNSYVRFGPREARPRHRPRSEPPNSPSPSPRTSARNTGSMSERSQRS